jgi:YegS/Rv2252/BmrU family lipid kinase
MGLLDRPAALIFNPHAGQKLGLSTNAGGPEAVAAALKAAGVEFVERPTQSAGHATVLAQEAIQEGRHLIIAAGGDGTVAEVAHGVAQTDAVLGVMPLGSIMNVARTLCVPRDLAAAAHTIANGHVLAMDLGRVKDRYFLEAAGVGLDAGLFSYFNRLDGGKARPLNVARGLIHFLRNIGQPRVEVLTPDRRLITRAPMVTVANGPFVGAAYAVAPDARLDDGLLDVVVFSGAGILRVLFHLAMVAGGRKLPAPPQARTFRTPWVEVRALRRRPLPAHVDGVTIGATPIRFESVPASLNVLVGSPDAGAACAWEEPFES